jgi:hypothetical protein
MQRLLKHLLAAGACVVFAGSAWGFSMQGPLAPWQTPRLGYDLNPALYGGPMAITEEYRWSVPEAYYSFTPEFVQYYGQRGMDEIDKVFQQLNSLPSASSIYDELDTYPLRSARVNHQAAALGLADLRSYFLSIALETMGLADPVRFVYTLRGRDTSIPEQTNYYVIRRNYDPVDWRTSPYINGQLWTYTAVQDVDDTHSFVFVDPVDPLAVLNWNLPVSGGVNNYTAGAYWTGLTRDDMGGIHYIYRGDNYNVETLAPNITYRSGGPWGVPPGTTNATGTNLLVATGVRPGRETVRFQRVDFDSLFGFWVPMTNQFEDTYITNGGFREQYLERPLTAPDILIHAADLGGDDTLSGVIGWGVAFNTWRYGLTNAVGVTNITGGGVNLGPGTIDPSAGTPAFTFTFSTLGELWLNIYPIDNLDEVTATHIMTWGSFDGSTNPPYTYPVGIEVRDVEQLVLHGRSGDPWGAPPNSGITTNNPGTGTGTTPTTP